MKLDTISIGALRRLTFRPLVVVVFAGLWPGPRPGMVSAAFCAFLAMGCVGAAIALGEPLFGPNLSRWHEAAVLFILACVIFFAS